MPKTSIITLTCDRPDYLAEAIASVEAQTDPDWEHLVYDNGEPDPRVADVLRSAKKRNPDRFFYTSPGLQGPERPALYWNILLGLSRGRYLTVLDDDNRKHPDFLEKMTGPLEADEKLDAVSCGLRYIDGAGKETGEESHANLETSIERLWRDNTIDSSALLFRRSVLDRIGHFSADLTTTEDWHFVIRLTKACQLRHLPEALVYYRRHATMRSHRAQALGVEENAARIRREMFE